MQSPEPPNLIAIFGSFICIKVRIFNSVCTKSYYSYLIFSKKFDICSPPCCKAVAVPFLKFVKLSNTNSLLKKKKLKLDVE